MKKAITIKEKRQEVLVFDEKYPKSVDLKYILKEPGAALDLFVKVLGRGKHKMDFNIEVVHAAKDTSSRVRTRCALWDDFCKGCVGNVKVEKRATGAQATLEMKDLLFSDRARAFVRPNMEISNDEVSASHAASIGRIDEGELFYLQSRGLKAKEAQEIFLNAFFNE